MTAIYQSRDLATAAADKLKVYAQPQRLMILSCLLRGERTVSEIDAITGIGQPALSQQLAELRRHDLVRTRREGRQIWYDLADDKVGLCVRSMEAILGNPESLDTPPPAAPVPPSEPSIAHPDTGAACFARIL